MLAFEQTHCCHAPTLAGPCLAPKSTIIGKLGEILSRVHCRTPGSWPSTGWEPISGKFGYGMVPKLRLDIFVRPWHNLNQFDTSHPMFKFKFGPSSIRLYQLRYIVHGLLTGYFIIRLWAFPHELATSCNQLFGCDEDLIWLGAWTSGRPFEIIQSVLDSFPCFLPSTHLSQCPCAQAAATGIFQERTLLTNWRWVELAPNCSTTQFLAKSCKVTFKTVCTRAQIYLHLPSTRFTIQKSLTKCRRWFSQRQILLIRETTVELKWNIAGRQQVADLDPFRPKTAQKPAI